MCSSHIENTISTVDSLLQIPYIKGLIKGLFGLQGLYDDDFASVLEVSQFLKIAERRLNSPKLPLEVWQSKNWDPAIDNTQFDEFCKALSKPIFGATRIAALPIGHEDRLLTIWDNFKIDFSILNYAQWIREVRGFLFPFRGNVEDIIDLRHKLNHALVPA